MRFMKSQEGLIIAGFALATVMIIALLVTYLSNRVVDMIAIQNQVFFSKQAYWNAYSGMELSTSKKIAGLDGISSPADVSFATGKITITQGAPDANGYLGGNKVSAITSTGNDVGGRSRAMKLTIGDPANYALSFDGDDDHVTLIDDNAFTFAGQITLSAWVVRDITNAGHVIVSKWDETSGSEKREWAFLMEANRGPKLSIYKESDDSNLTKDVDISPSTGVWHHLAATYDGNSVIKLYVDGILQNVERNVTSGTVSNLLTYTQSLTIGAYKNNSTNTGHHFEGSISEFSVFSGDKTSNPSTYYNNGIPYDVTNEDDLQGYWKMSEGSGTTVTDLSGEGNDGTIDGATWITMLEK